MEGLKTYTWNFSYHFEYESDGKLTEGDIIIGSGNHGGETYPYVSHIEITDGTELSDDTIEEIETELENNYDKYIVHAEKYNVLGYFYNVQRIYLYTN